MSLAASSPLSNLTVLNIGSGSADSDSTRNSAYLLFGLFVLALSLGVGLFISWVRTAHDQSQPTAERFYNPLAAEQTKLVNTGLLGPIFCHSSTTHRDHEVVYWEIRRKHVPLSSGLHRYCEGRYRKLRLCLTLVSHFSNRLRDVHPHDFEEVEVELEAMYSAVWSNIARAWYREPTHWEFFIQKVYGRFYLTPEFMVWSRELDDHVKHKCTVQNQFSLFADRMFLPLGLTAVAVIGVLSFRLDYTVQAFAFYLAGLALLSGALGLQGFLAYHSFHRRSKRYRGVLLFWTRRLIRLAYAISVVLDDYYELWAQRNEKGDLLRPWRLPSTVWQKDYEAPSSVALEKALGAEADPMFKQGLSSIDYSVLWNHDYLSYCESIEEFVKQKKLENTEEREAGHKDTKDHASDIRRNREAKVNKLHNEAKRQLQEWPVTVALELHHRQQREQNRRQD